MKKIKLNYHDRLTIAENGLIGIEAVIINASDRSLIGMQGKIIDETLNTIKIRTKTGDKTVQKSNVLLKLSYKKPILVDGKDLIQRPEERIKKWWRKLKPRRRAHVRKNV